MVQLLWKTVWRLLRNLKIEIHMMQQSHFWVYIPSPPNLKAGSQGDICTPMFTAAFFTRAEGWTTQMSING